MIPGRSWRRAPAKTARTGQADLGSVYKGDTLTAKNWVAATVVAVMLACPLGGQAQENPPHQRVAMAPAQTDQKVITDQAEYDAYIAALNTQDPAQRAAAMEAFLQRYPNSVVRLDALEQALGAYQQIGNQAKVEETARRLLAIDPNNVRALAIIAFLARSRGDGVEAGAYGERGLRALAAWQKPASMADADFERLRRQVMDIFYGAVGFAALKAKDYAKARASFLQALQISPDTFSDVYNLAIAELETNPIDVMGFWHIARAFDLATTPEARKAIGDYGLAKYRRYHGSDAGWEDLIAQAKASTTPPPGFNVTQEARPPALTPQEMAVKAVTEHDPLSLSFSDWEFILGFRDASPANREAADKVWQAIRRMQKDGAIKIKIPGVKVIAAAPQSINAAITEDNQKTSTVDLRIAMEKPMAQVPPPGASICIIGVLIDYKPKPFVFIMEHGELAHPDEC